MVFAGFADAKTGKFSKFTTPQKFGVYFRKLRKPAMIFQMRGDAGASLTPLFRRFEQKLSHIAGSQALHQIIKWAVLESAPATAVGFTAGQVLFDVGGPQKIRWDENLLQQRGLPLLQGFDGMFDRINCLNHNNS
jgi:hypothetical protein